jgi:hypothetical protein
LAGIVGILIIIAIVTAVGFVRVASVYGISWLETPTLTPSPTVTHTITPSPTVTSSSTVTPRPSATPVPSLTPTIVPTATAAPLAGAVNKDSAARLTPSGGAPWAFSLKAFDPVQVLEQTTDARGYLWYKILYVRDESILIGWALAEDINVQPAVAPN